MTRKIIHDISDFPVRRFLRSIDWQLLLFLVLFLNVKVYIKLIAIILIYTLRFDFRLGLRWRSSRLPLFYPAMIGIALLDWLLYGLYADRNYTICLGCGILFWVVSLLAMHQVKRAIERSDAETLHRTLRVFFLINAAISFLVLARIMIATRTINPYDYQGEFQKYFLGTGDFIRGLSFEGSSTNALINAFGVIYFLSRRQVLMMLTCMSVLLLTGSNAVDLLLILILVWMFIFRTGREGKSLILLSTFLLILFMTKVSPQNFSYISERFDDMTGRTASARAKEDSETIWVAGMPDSLLNTEQKRQKIAILYMDSVSYIYWKRKDSIDKVLGIKIPYVRPLPRPDINAPFYQSRNDTTDLRLKLIEFVKEQGMGMQLLAAKGASERLPGKIVAMRQTSRFMAEHPGKLLTGNGMGRFSSKLAFRSTALGIAGGYPLSLAYIDRDFRDLHFALYLYYFTQVPAAHSVLNTPDNVYDQLLAEYGLAGLGLFLFLYIGFFARHFKRLTYGLPLLLMMGFAFCTGYWFEQLSVVVLFEFMMLLDMGGTAYAR